MFHFHLVLIMLEQPLDNKYNVQATSILVWSNFIEPDILVLIISTFSHYNLDAMM
jgi:hypothetical protein